MTNVILFLYSRSQVKVKVRGQNVLYEWKALVTRNLHAKYEGSTSNASKVIGLRSIFFFKVGHMSRSRPQVKIFCMSGNPLSQETYMSNIKAVSEMVQNL